MDEYTVTTELQAAANWGPTAHANVVSICSLFLNNYSLYAKLYVISRILKSQKILSLTKFI
jgi:hypothetical protein